MRRDESANDRHACCCAAAASSIRRRTSTRPATSCSPTATIEAVGRLGEVRRDGDELEVDRLRRSRRVAGLHRRALPPARAGTRGRGDDRDRRARGGGRRVHRRLRDAEHRPGHRQPGGGRLRPPAGAARRRRRACIRSARSRSARRARRSRSSARWSARARSRSATTASRWSSAQLMRTALEYARTFGIPVADHCEEPTLAAGGAMNEGIVSARLGLKGIPAEAEEIMAIRDILLARRTGGHVHLCHMSTRGLGGADPLGQGARHQRDRGGVPAPPLAHRGRGRGVRHEREDEPAAAHRRRTSRRCRRR